MIAEQIGPYRLIKELGAGGMGSVWLGEHVVLGHLRALKVLDARFTMNPSVVNRFVNEARATAKLNHPNLVHVYHVDQLASGLYYMELEYLQGQSLRHYLASRAAPLPAHLALRVLGPIASCLKHAHALGVVHRDLKPENLFLVADDKQEFIVKVLDLGVAQLTGEVAKGPSTRAGTVIGTPSYMAPEQARGERVTPAADTYALGVIAYEMLTGGWLPYRMPNETLAEYFDLPDNELYVRVRTIAPIDPRHRDAAISDRLAHVVMQMIESDPAKRPSSIGAAVLMLAEAASADGDHPDGVAVLREVAVDLIPPAELGATMRSISSPIEIASASKADSRYRVIEKLGAGGMAEVFLAEALGEAGFSRRVALKRVLPGLSERPEFAKMFVTEARLASALSHTNIVSVLDFSKDASGRLFLVMEYVHGRDLAAVLEAGPLSPSLLIYIVVEILRGLGYAHEFADPTGAVRGLVHRDVSPHNVLVSYEGAVKLNDFGLAKAKSASGNAYSENARGKVSYMSPEQCNGSPLDGRSDLFAIGVMLWEALANDTLFKGTPSECVAQIMFKSIPLPSTLRSRIPSDLESIAMRLLQRERDARFPNAEAAIEGLLQCKDAPRNGRDDLARLIAQRFPDAQARRSGGSSGQPLRALVAQQFTVPSPPTTLGGATSQSLVVRRSRRGLFVALASAVVVAGVVTFVVAAKKHTTMEPIQTAGVAPIVLDAPRFADALASIAAISIDAISIDAGVLPDARAPVDAQAPVVDARAPVDAGTPVRVPSSTSVAHAHAQATQPQGIGGLAVYVTPWAMATLDGKSIGQTPLHLDKVSVGHHSLQIANEESGKRETIPITINADQTTTIQRTW